MLAGDSWLSLLSNSSQRGIFFLGLCWRAVSVRGKPSCCRGITKPCGGSLDLCFCFIVQVSHICQLQIDTCQENCQQVNNRGICHLPGWRLNLVLLQVLTFKTSWGSSGWSEALRAPGNLVGPDFRYIFSGTDTIIGEGNGTPLQYFCLENPMDGGT